MKVTTERENPQGMGRVALRRLAVAAVVGAAFAWGDAATAQEPDPDLLKLGQSLLPDDQAHPKKKPVRRRKGDAGVALDGGSDAGAVDAGPAALESVADAATTTTIEADAAVTTANAAEPATGAGAPKPAEPAAEPPKPEVPPPPPVPGIGPGARQARISSGANLTSQGAIESPLVKLGIPVAAVPAIATAITVTALGIWPFLAKTITGLFKSVLGAFLKSRAKKGQKIDREQRVLRAGGFVIRPFELGSLLVGALVYGLGVCYAFQGRHLKPSFLVGQEALIVLIYYSRAFIRFGYERAFKLPTQFRFWLGGGFLCLASAYLGNALGTVGYEIEESTTSEQAKRIVRMKAWLIVFAVVMSIGFFAANVRWPMKVLQSGRVMMSGMALAEVLPFAPMPGKKIYDDSPLLWFFLVILVIPTFTLINFVL